MLRPRVIPTLLLSDGSLVKTSNFRKPVYVGDPCNTVRIFNELEVDELCILDISQDRFRRGPDLSLVKDLTSECFMPLSYGGGISSLKQARDLFSLGVEKIVLNTSAITKPSLINSIASVFGSQSLIVSIDVKRGLFGNPLVQVNNGRHGINKELLSWTLECESRGAGEILLTSIPAEGSWKGLDLALTSLISSSVSVPVIAHGGAGSVDHIYDAINEGNASAVALGSMITFQGRNKGVLVNFPDIDYTRFHDKPERSPID